MNIFFKNYKFFSHLAWGPEHTWGRPGQGRYGGPSAGSEYRVHECDRQQKDDRQTDRQIKLRKMCKNNWNSSQRQRFRLKMLLVV